MLLVLYGGAGWGRWENCQGGVVVRGEEEESGDWRFFFFPFLPAFSFSFFFFFLWV